MAYRELLLRQRINEGAAACMLSHATGDDLDNIAANLDTNASPSPKRPTPPTR
jgi:phage-related baseplate assembly protein